MKRAYRNLFSISALMLLLFSGNVNAQAAEAPIYDDANKIFYANGTPIVIDDHSTSSTGAMITWEGGSQEVAQDVVIFGGGDVGTSFDSASITLEGGVVDKIHGGGRGSETEAANVGQVTLNINGGKVPYAIWAGGRLTSDVDKVVVNMTGGEVDYLYGACHATDGSESVGVITDLKNSPCHVDEVEINISGGQIGMTENIEGVLYGGGQGLSYTGKSSIKISGDVDLTKTYVALSGSHGMTESGSVFISSDYKGEIYKLYSINRGSMKNAYFEIGGGVINELYVLQYEELPSNYSTLPEAVMEGAEFRAYIGDNATVKSLQLGIDKNTVVGPNQDYVSVEYVKGTVENVDDLESIFGSSAYVSIEATEDGELLASDLNQSIGRDMEIGYGRLDEDGYEWTFNLKDETEELTSDINLNVTEIEANEDMSKDEVLEKAKNSVILEFSHSGSLPKNTKFYYQTEYEEGTALKLYYYDEEDKKFEFVQDVEVLGGGVVEISLEHCSIYAFVEEGEEEEVVPTPTPAPTPTPTPEVTPTPTPDTENENVSNQPEIESPSTLDSGLTYMLVAAISLVVVSSLVVYFKKQFAKN